MRISKDRPDDAIRIDVDEPDGCSILGDRRQLVSAVSNLIDNAVAYGGNARITVECDNDQACLHIDDDGPGMTALELSSAAEPFFRGETSRNRSTGGAGLGITLAEAIARAHHGALFLRNRTPHGLRATIRIPLALKRAPAQAAS
jgi:signal transduction histidine kinase